MAVSKKTILRVKKPETLYEIPEPDYKNNTSCPCHEDCPAEHKCIKLYDSYEEAVIACSQVFLKPGESHTEFYKDGKNIHCVIAIGNINPNKGHLYLEDLSNSDESVRIWLNAIESQGTKNSNSITKLTSLIKDISTNLNNYIIKNVGDINAINASISTIFDNLTNYISNSSIDSLFDKDIYTLNLCCYTDAGYIKINDGYPTNGDYRTYVNGDKISLTACKKPGYIFKEWSKNGETILEKPTLDLTFNNSDINTIATTDDDPAIVKNDNKYIAVFYALNKITKRIEITNNDVAELDGDDVLIDGLTEDPCYFENGSTIKLTAQPIPNHTFDHYVINGQEYDETNPRILKNMSSNISVVAYFTEIRYHIHGEADDIRHGDVESDHPTTVLKGTDVKLTAKPADGYEFVEWKKSNDGSNYVKDGDHTSETIEIKVTENTWYQAVFEEA